MLQCSVGKVNNNGICSSQVSLGVYISKHSSLHSLSDVVIQVYTCYHILWLVKCKNFYFWNLLQTMILQATMASSRFASSECNETRSWEEISSTYINAQHMFQSGSLGALATANFEVWACFWGHRCLYVLPQSPNTKPDAMCYMYHEQQQMWHPWGLMSEIQMCMWSNHGSWQSAWTSDSNSAREHDSKVQETPSWQSSFGFEFNKNTVSYGAFNKFWTIIS